MKLVKNAIIDILIPKDATPRESFAASELKKYLELMLDASVRITDESGGNNARFIIGGPERNFTCAATRHSNTLHESAPGENGRRHNLSPKTKRATQFSVPPSK